MKASVKNVKLEELVDALRDIGNNRLPLDIIERISDLKRFLIEAIERRDSVKGDLIRPHIPEGKQVPDKEAEGYDQLVTDVLELMEREIEIHFEPIGRSHLLKAIFKEGSYALLKELGIIKGKSDAKV